MAVAVASARARRVSGARAEGKRAACAYAAFLVAAGCGGRYAAVGQPECAAERAPIASAAPSAIVMSAPPDAGTSSLPKRFYVAAAGRCSEWGVSNGMAENTRRGPLGEVVLEFKIRAGGTGLAGDESFRRIGPLERIQDSLDSLECYPCFLERDLELAYPWQSCEPYRRARWFTDLADCAREAAVLKSSPDAGSRGGWELRNSVACELSEEAERAHDAEDRAAYDAANRKLESARATMQKRLRSLQEALSRTRQVFVREGGRCEAWNLRQDADSPSGWISRQDPIASGHQLTEFRFAATPEDVRLTGWIQTALPSRESASEEIHYGSVCEGATTLTDVSERSVKFTDQVWFLSRAACEKGADEGLNGFGPGCDRMGR